MKLSENTIEILKNFATLNQSLLFQKGSVLTTITPQRTVLAIARVVESFPSDFCVYDLNKLLAKLSLYKECDLDFEVDRVVFKSADGRRSDYIKYCSPKVIVSPPSKQLVLDNPDYEFSLSQEDLHWQRKSAGISGSQHFVFEGDGNKVRFQCTDVKDDSSDMSSTEIANYTGKPFTCVVKGENFKMIDGSYAVKISTAGLTKFENSDKNVDYFVAVESGLSTFK